MKLKINVKNNVNVLSVKLPDGILLQKCVNYMVMSNVVLFRLITSSIMILSLVEAFYHTCSIVYIVFPQVKYADADSHR